MKETIKYKEENRRNSLLPPSVLRKVKIRRIKSEIEEGMEWLNWDETIKSINECGRNLSDFRDLYRDEIFEQIETLEEDMVCLKKMLDKFRMVNCEEWDYGVSYK